MNNFIQPGATRPFTAPTGGVVSGGVYKIGQRLVVATGDKAEAEIFQGQTVGVFSVTKVGSQAWTVGALVYWDDSNKYFTTTTSSNLLAGDAFEAVGSGAGETTGKVHLNGIVLADEPA